MEGATRMTYSVKFNGIELGEFIDVLQDFSPLSGVDWSPGFSNTGGTRKGADFAFTTYKSKSIPMPFTMLGNLENKYDELEKILNVNEPKELIFESLPDRVFYAIPDGDLDFTEDGPLGEGTITWIIPDGVAHASVGKSFPASENEEGILEATIINSGTGEAPVSYNITHNHENGFLGIVSEYGAIQLGKIDEVDAVPAQKSEVLFRCDSADEFLSTFTVGEGIFDKNQNYGRDGTFGSVSLNGRQWLALNSVGTGSSWHGAIMKKDLPADSSGVTGAKNFTCQYTMWFETGKVPQTGAIEVVIGDSADKQLASMHIVKSSANSNICSAVFQVGSVEKGRVKYEPGYWSYTAKGGVIKIVKTGERFEFHFNGKKYSYSDSSLKDKEAYSVSVSEIQYSNRGKGNLVTHMYFGYLYFQKDNVEYLKDIPNRYPEDSVVYVDGEAGKVYVDGIPSQQDEVKGSKYFKVPPGETKVQFYYSDFSDPPPTVEARIREAFL